MLYLVEYPEYQRRMREEIFKSIGSRTPSFVNICDTPLVEAFLWEVQRLRPIAPLALPRLI